MACRILFAACLLAGCGTPTSQELVDAGAPTGDGDMAGPDGGAMEPVFTSLPWESIGTGVAFKDSHNPLGENAFIGYAGQGVTDDQARAWVTALYDKSLRAHGIRYVYAVRGPASIEYTEKEIQNSHLIAHLLPKISATTKIAIAGHSSGGWVACELLQQLYDQDLDPLHRTAGRATYFDLDGVESCLDHTIVDNLHQVYFISAHTSAGGGGYSLNAPGMMTGAMIYGLDRFKLYDASESGCLANASLCLHVSLVVTKPHDPSTGTPSDYADFVNRPVNSFYLDQFFSL